MKAFKKATLWTFIGGTSIMLIWGAFNSPVLNNNAFTSNKFNITFAKRLDEISGEVVKGRMAASLGNENKWRSLSTDLIKKQAKELITQKVSTAKAAPKRESSNDDKVVQNAPAIVDTPRLSLSGGLFNKKPMTVQGSEAVFTGSAKVTDGIVEDLSITLPDGKTISIFALNERMNGNVFTYEDTGTGILKSGLLYEVSGGVMVTLTDDSQYPGLRLEFKTGESIAAQNQEENWELNDQNLEAEDAFENKESEQQEYAQNDYSEEDVYYDEENENTEQVQGEEQQNYGFSF